MKKSRRKAPPTSWLANRYLLGGVRPVCFLTFGLQNSTPSCHFPCAKVLGMRKNATIMPTATTASSASITPRRRHSPWTSKKNRATGARPLPTLERYAQQFRQSRHRASPRGAHKTTAPRHSPPHLRTTLRLTPPKHRSQPPGILVLRPRSGKSTADVCAVARAARPHCLPHGQLKLSGALEQRPIYAVGQLGTSAGAICRRAKFGTDAKVLKAKLSVP